MELELSTDHIIQACFAIFETYQKKVKKGVAPLFCLD